MSNKIIELVKIIVKPKLLKKLISMNSCGYLYDIGWINSFDHQMPVDKESNPLPWVTYGFIEFVSERLNISMDVFEYGSGNSTSWYAGKVKSVTSVEHDKRWFEKIKSRMPNNVNIYYQELISGGEYSKSPNKSDKKFDIIIVDGRDRVNCAINSIHNIKEDGVIVIDDTERECYREGIEFLLNQDFKKIDFWGFSPGLFYKKNTTVFYKKDNCLGI